MNFDIKLHHAIERTDNFRADPKIATESAALADYKGSGYDRGHVAPAADMRRSILLRRIIGLP